ncbi:hypothetical protein [Caenispirillum salinarum]
MVCSLPWPLSGGVGGDDAMRQTRQDIAIGVEADAPRWLGTSQEGSMTGC